MTETDPLKILTDKQISDGVDPKYTTESYIEGLRKSFPPPHYEVGYFPELEYNYWISFNSREIDSNDLEYIKKLGWVIKNIQSTGKEIVIRIKEAYFE